MRSLRRNGIGIMAASVALCLGGNVAAQTNYGNTGLFVHPTAELPLEGRLRANLSYLHLPASSQNAENHWVPFNVAYRPSDRTEIGATYLHRFSRNSSFSSGGLYGKYLLVKEEGKTPGIGVIGNFLSGDIRLNSVSVAVSKSFRSEERTYLSLHLGGQYVGWQTNTRKSTGIRGFIGASIPISERFNIIGELGTRLHFDRAATSGVGLQYNTPSGMNLGIGYVNNGQSRNGGFFFGVGIPLGGN